MPLRSCTSMWASTISRELASPLRIACASSRAERSVSASRCEVNSIRGLSVRGGSYSRVMSDQDVTPYLDALVLGGMRPTFVQPELDPELGIAHCITPDSLGRALDETPGAVGAIVVSPTYFGACADVRGLAETAHGHDVPLVVDEAWGAHL